MNIAINENKFSEKMFLIPFFKWSTDFILITGFKDSV